MKLFHLIRNEDVSGVSGTGIVAEGCVFTDGTVALRWYGLHSSLEFHKSAEDLISIHGHGGRTTLRFIE